MLPGFQEKYLKLILKFQIGRLKIERIIRRRAPGSSCHFLQDYREADVFNSKQNREQAIYPDKLKKICLPACDMLQFAIQMIKHLIPAKLFSKS